MSSQYHNTLYTGDVADRVKLLRTVGQGECIAQHACKQVNCDFFWIRHSFRAAVVCVCVESLAYLTAATHGLSEEAQTIADSLQPNLEKVRIELS